MTGQKQKTDLIEQFFAAETITPRVAAVATSGIYQGLPQIGGGPVCSCRPGWLTRHR